MPTVPSNIMSSNQLLLPAHDTKHIPLLVYPFRDNVIFHIAQSDNGANNGTALWLGAQILSAYLSDTPRLNMTTTSSPSSSIDSIPIQPQQRQSCKSWRVIELGSGVGLIALTLAAQGWSVLATDIQPVVLSVLRPNILRNTRNTPTTLPGSVQARTLDWTVPPENWDWSNPESITPQSPADNMSDDISQAKKIFAVRTSSSSSFQDDGEREAELFGPPFDLILTADTIYSPDLIMPLLRTLKHLILLSTSAQVANSGSKQKKLNPSVYIALEKRDPVQLASFFSQARDTWGLTAQRIPTPRIRRAMSCTGLAHWKKEDWQGVEVWRMHLRDSNAERHASGSAPSS